MGSSQWFLELCTSGQILGPQHLRLLPQFRGSLVLQRINEHRYGHDPVNPADASSVAITTSTHAEIGPYGCLCCRWTVSHGDRQSVQCMLITMLQGRDHKYPPSIQSTKRSSEHRHLLYVLFRRVSYSGIQTDKRIRQQRRRCLLDRCRMQCRHHLRMPTIPSSDRQPPLPSLPFDQQLQSLHPQPHHVSQSHDRHSDDRALAPAKGRALLSRP